MNNQFSPIRNPFATAPWLGGNGFWFQPSLWGVQKPQTDKEAQSKTFPWLPLYMERKINDYAFQNSYNETQRNLLANDLYKEALKQKAERDMNQTRQEVIRESYARSERNAGSRESNQHKSNAKALEVVEMIRGYAKENGADLGGLNDMQVLQSFVAKNPETQDAINNYLAGDQSATDFAETMGFTPPVPQENWVEGQGGVKGYFGRQNGWEWNDQFFGRLTPTDEATTAGGIFKEFGANLLKSGVNLASDIGNMLFNPRDTAKGLTKGVVGGVANLVWGAQNLVGVNEENQLDNWLDRQWGWRSDANNVADSIGSALAERYGSFDKFSKTAYTDPVGAFSDIMSVLVPVASGVKTGANLGAKGAQFAKLTKTASTLSKVADVAGDIVKVADAVDPANLVMKGIGKGASYGAGSIKKGIQKLDLWEKAQSIISGLDKETRKGIQNNPYVNEYWGDAKKIIEEGVWPQTKQITTRGFIEKVGSDLLQKIDRASEIFSETWPLYWKIKEINARVDISPALDKIDDILSKHDIKVKGDWSFDFDYSAVASPVDQSAIKTLIERLESWKVNDTRTVLNLRKVADGLSKWDGTTTDGLKVVRDIRRAVDEVAKEQIPWLKELDELYRARIDDYNEIREGLVYKQGSRKGEIRDNFNQIIKTIGGENRARMAERLSEIAPDLVERVDAINAVWKLIDSYINPPELKKMVWPVWWTIAWWVIGAFSSQAMPWAILWYILSGLWENIAKSLSRKRLDKIASTMSPEAIQKLQSINAKLAENADLSRSDRYLLNTIKEKIENYREFDNQENLPYIEAIKNIQSKKDLEKFLNNDNTEKNQNLNSNSNQDAIDLHVHSRGASLDDWQSIQKQTAQIEGSLWEINEGASWRVWLKWNIERSDGKKALTEESIIEKYRQKAIQELGLPEWTTEINLAELMGDKKKYAKYQEITAEMQKELWYLWEDGYYTKKWYDDLESRKRKAYGEQKHSLRDDEGLNKLREWAETKKKVLNEWIDSLSMTLRIDKIAKEKWFNKGNHLVKMIDLNKSIKKGSWKRSLQDKEIYKLKDEIILDQVIKRWEPIKDMWDNTTFTVKYKWVFVKWHVWTKVLKKLRKLWLLK